MVRRSLCIPAGVWAWQGTVLVVLMIVLPTLATLWLDPGARTLSGAGAVVGLTVHPVILVGVIVLGLARPAGDHSLAWLSAALTAIAIRGFSLAGLRVTYGERLDDHALSLIVLDLLLVGAATAAVMLGHRIVPPAEPVVLGVGAGIVVTALQMVLIEGAPPASTSPFVLGAAGGLLLALHGLLALAIAQLSLTPPWARGRLVAAVLVLGLDQAVFLPAGDSAADALAPLTGILGAALVSTAVLGLLRASISDRRSEVVELNERVELVEQRNRRDREQLHEINAALAGIATASRLIREDSRIPVERRARLERLVDSELDRLQGLGRRVVPKIRALALDDTVEAVVTTQQILGRTVHWSPAGHVVLGRAEHIAEVLTTLLENAARHAPGSPVWIRVRTDDEETVELTVADVGPGISAELSARLFHWGQRGPASPGEGIGLSVARELMEGLGGSLRHVPTDGSGAVFAVRLPLVRSLDGHAVVSA